MISGWVLALHLSGLRINQELRQVCYTPGMSLQQ